MASKRGSHTGSLAKGFMDGLLASLKYGMYADHYKAMDDYYRWRMDPNNPMNLNPEGGAFGGGAGKGLGGIGGGWGSGSGAVGGDFTTEQMLAAAQKAGFSGDDAAHIVAIAQAESGGRLGAVGSAGELGLTQINPHAWGQDMAKSAGASLQGSFDAAYTVFKKQGWGAWSTDPSSPNFTPNNSMGRFLGTTRTALHNTERGVTAPGETEVAKKGETPKETQERVKDDTMAKPVKGDKSAQAFTPYQTAGTVPIALSPEDAAKAAADLDAHRARPGDEEPPLLQVGPPGGKPWVTIPEPSPTGGRARSTVAPDYPIRDSASGREPYAIPPDPDHDPSKPSAYYAHGPVRPSTPAELGPENVGDIYDRRPEVGPENVGSDTIQPAGGYPSEMFPAPTSTAAPTYDPRTDPLFGGVTGAFTPPKDQPGDVDYGVGPPGMRGFPAYATKGQGFPPYMFPSGRAAAPRAKVTPKGDADKPSKDAQPTKGAIPAKAGDKGDSSPFTVIHYDVPGTAGRRGQGPPITAFDFSKWKGPGGLWGNTTPNQPAAQPAKTASAAPAPAPAQPRPRPQPRAAAPQPAPAQPAPATTPSPQPANPYPPRGSGLPGDQDFGHQFAGGYDDMPPPMSPDETAYMNEPTVAAAKGGAIPSRPMMRFQAGGAAPIFQGATTANPSQGYSPQQYLASIPNFGISAANLASGNYTAQQMSDALSALTPEQSQYMAQQRSLHQQGSNFAAMGTGMQGMAVAGSGRGYGAGPSPTPYMNQAMSYNQQANQMAIPAAPTPAAAAAPAAAAPAPVATAAPPTPTVTSTDASGAVPGMTGSTADPTISSADTTTTGTTTGAYKLPNTVAPSASWDQPGNVGGDIANYDQGASQKKSGSTYDVAADATTSQILSRRGGPIQRFQGGGDVSDPGASPMGMPPGMGGQQQIPPIYYNPATYAAAGAPVGKGVTSTSAPVYTGAAIPSLPMMRGGVVRFADGGSAEADPDTSYEDMRMMQEVDSGTPRGGGGSYPAIPEGVQVASAGGLGGFGGGMRMPTPRVGGGMRMPSPGAGGSRARGGGDYPILPEGDQGDGGQHPATNPNLPLHTPQISDQNGNPSPSLVSMIGSGLHWLAERLGLAPGPGQGGAIANDPGAQQAQGNFARGNMPDGSPGMTDEQWLAKNELTDPNHTLTPALHNLAGMEAVYNYAMVHGRAAEAEQAAAMMLQKSVMISQSLSKQAVQAIMNRDLQSGLDLLKEAKAAIADGTLMDAKITPDGQVEVSGHNLNQEELWRRIVAPKDILAAAVHGASGRAGWDAYEEAAGKYSPEYAAQVAARKQAAKEAAAQDVEEQTSRAVAAQPSWAQPYQPPQVTPVGDQGSTQAPVRATHAVATGDQVQPPASTASADTTGGAQQPVKPAGADQTGAQPAIPPRPIAPASLAARGTEGGELAHLGRAQEAEAAQATAESDRSAGGELAAIKANYFTPDNGLIMGDRVWHRQPPPQPTGNPKVDARLLADWKAQDQFYTQNYANAVANMNRDLAVAKEGRQGQLHDLMQRRGEYWKEQAASVAAQRASERQATAAGLTTQRQQEEQKRGWTHEEQKPAGWKDIEETFRTTSPSAFIASLPRNAVMKSDGSVDENASAQKLGQTYDLPDASGQKTGGAERISILGDVVRNGATWNTHIGPNQVADLVDGLARKMYSIDTPQPVDHGYGPMVQVNVYRGQRGAGSPVPLLLPQSDFDAIAGIRAEFVNAVKPSAPAAPGPAMPSAPSFPGTTPGATPQTGFNAPAGQTPEWWKWAKPRILGTAPGGPTFGQPAQSQGGYP